MAAQTQVEGRFLGGRPPYGYRLADAGEHPHPAKAADGRRVYRLEPDPVTAPVVRRIYAEYLFGIGIFAIAQRLTAEGVPCPSAYDRARNRHRCGVAWSKSAVRAILLNPRYTGRQVWNKQRKQESLIDVEDVALGHRTALKWNPREAWVFSDRRVHEALINDETYEQVRVRMVSRGASSTGRVVRTRRPYALRGLLFCGACGRRMQGNWNHGKPYYRCRFPSEYALANKVDHPANVYLAQDRLLEPLDAWLAEVFASDQVRKSLTMLEQSQAEITPELDQARRVVAECDRKLARHRAALEAGTDPELVAGWTRQVQQERGLAQARLARIEPHAQQPRLTSAQIGDLVDALGGLLAVLTAANPADKTEVYRQLGVRLTFDHQTQVVEAETQPQPTVGVLVVSEGVLAH